jgi:ribonuclease G
MYENLKQATPPKRVLGEMNRTNTVLRDLLSGNFTKIHVNDTDLAGEIRDYLRKVSPDQEKIVRLAPGEDLFDTLGVNRQIKAAFGKQVNLKSGAYLIVEHTEAMHVIDVNSGSRKGGDRNQEQNALETNLECAEEIARVLRLRDMGGIIVVDFIDMHNKAHQKQLFEKLKECMKEDKAKHNVLPPSKFGVVEITRQRVREVTDIVTEEVCPTCEGTGKTEAAILITDEIENNLRYYAEELKLKKLVLRVHPFLEAYYKKGLISMRFKLAAKYKVSLAIEPDNDYHMLKYKFFHPNGEPVDD